jgi:hypothetical protein
MSERKLVRELILRRRRSRLPWIFFLFHDRQAPEGLPRGPRALQL